MTTTTDLLRRAAELLRGYVNTYEQVSEDEPGGYCSDEDAEMDGVAASLLALADQMERAVPVGWLESPYKMFARNHAYKMTASQATSWRIPLYTHPAPELTRDATK